MTYAGDYDYEDSQELPAGCLLEYLDEQPSVAASPDAAVAHAAPPLQAASPGVRFIRGTEFPLLADHSALAPPTLTASRKLTMASAAHAAMLDSSGTERHGQATLLCKPIGVARDRWHKVAVICWTVIPPSIFLIVVMVCFIAICCDEHRRRQVQT